MFTFTFEGLFNTKVTIHWTTVFYVALLYTISVDLGLIYTIALASVLLHEFGHIYAGQKYGAKTGDVTLYPIGGIAQVDISNNYTGQKEFFIAIAGPLVNVALATLFLPLWALTDWKILLQIGGINIALFIFNLLPCFPMDGGRIYRSLLYMVFNDLERSTKYAVRLGQLLFLSLTPLAIYYGYFTTPILLLIMSLAGEMELKGIRKNFQKVG